MKKGKGNDLMTDTTLDLSNTSPEFRHAVERVGFGNALILSMRNARHVQGRDMLLTPVTTGLLAMERIPHKVGPMKETIHLPSTAPNTDFLARMLVIEKEFFHGQRKRSWE